MPNPYRRMSHPAFTSDLVLRTNNMTTSQTKAAKCERCGRFHEDVAENKGRCNNCILELIAELRGSADRSVVRTTRRVNGQRKKKVPLSTET